MILRLIRINHFIDLTSS